VLKAFEQAKAKCLEELEDTATCKCTLPFVDEQLKAAREVMGHEFWSYGLAPNRKVLETFLRHPADGEVWRWTVRLDEPTGGIVDGGETGPDGSIASLAC
jgi:4,5-dihydroxyphthalate decarboxylase